MAGGSARRARVALALPASASADLRDEQALAERYAPVVRLVEQPEECGPGEPYEPIDVDAALRRADRRAPRPVERAPTSSKIAPDRRRPRRRSTSTTSTSPATRSTRAATTSGGRAASRRAPSRPSTRTSPPRPAYPGKLALQYWFFYPFNDFNNTHEGDWEMIQLVFDAGDAARGARATSRSRSATAARGRGARRRGATTSSRSSTARIRSCTRPPARTRTSSTRRSTSAARPRQGVGCDDTPRPARRAPARGARRSRATRAAAEAAFPWIAFEGRWGELQQAFFNGPTGPNLKDAVDGADHVVGGLARPELRGPDRRRSSARARPTSSAAAVASGLEGARPAAPQPGADRSLAPRRARSGSSSSRSRARPGRPSRRCASRAAPLVGPDPRRRPRGCTSSGRGSSSGIGAAPDPDRRS